MQLLPSATSLRAERLVALRRVPSTCALQRALDRRVAEGRPRCCRVAGISPSAGDRETRNSTESRDYMMLRTPSSASRLAQLYVQKDCSPFRPKGSFGQVDTPTSRDRSRGHLQCSGRGADHRSPAGSRQRFPHAQDRDVEDNRSQVATRGAHRRRRAVGDRSRSGGATRPGSGQSRSRRRSVRGYRSGQRVGPVGRGDGRGGAEAKGCGRRKRGSRRTQ